MDFKENDNFLVLTSYKLYFFRLLPLLLLRFQVVLYDQILVLCSDLGKTCKLWVSILQIEQNEPKLFVLRTIRGVPDIFSLEKPHYFKRLGEIRRNPTWRLHVFLPSKIIQSETTIRLEPLWPDNQ